jgi:hypothetical protein
MSRRRKSGDPSRQPLAGQRRATRAELEARNVNLEDREEFVEFILMAFEEAAFHLLVANPDPGPALVEWRRRTGVLIDRVQAGSPARNLPDERSIVPGRAACVALSRMWVQNLVAAGCEPVNSGFVQRVLASTDENDFVAGIVEVRGEIVDGLVRQQTCDLDDRLTDLLGGAS